MRNFAEAVFDDLGELQGAAGFVPAPPYSNDEYAVLLKRVAEDTYAYVQVSDGRRGGASVVVSLWVAPIHEPGDGLDNLGVGYKIRVASEFEIDTEYFQSCGRRIITLLPHVASLGEPIRKELATPAARSRRYDVYLLERMAYEALRRSDRARGALEAFAAGVRSGQATYDVLEGLAIRAAEQLIAEGTLGGPAGAYYGADSVVLGTSLMGLMYVDIITT